MCVCVAVITMCLFEQRSPSVCLCLFPVVWSVGAFSSVFRTVPLFSSQVFSCPLPLSSVPQASITWTGPQLGSNSVGVSQDGRLVFSAYNPAMRNSFETYRCMISNDISMDSFNSLQLNLRDQTGKVSLLLCGWCIISILVGLIFKFNNVIASHSSL